jgi:hypothetical protein
MKTVRDGNRWRYRRGANLRAAALHDRRTAALARLFDENRERTNAEAFEPRAPAGIDLRPRG